jgi:hypothetical protein
MVASEINLRSDHARKMLLGVIITKCGIIEIADAVNMAY